MKCNLCIQLVMESMMQEWVLQIEDGIVLLAKVQQLNVKDILDTFN